MPIIRITEDDINRSKQPSAGWHLGKIEKFDATESKDKKSTNWVFEIVITEPDKEDDGRYMYARFNSKAPGMLISSGFLPSALDNPELTAMELNPEELYGKQLFCEVKDSVYEGRIQKKTDSFAPASRPPF
jgi:hypothetical protein